MALIFGAIPPGQIQFRPGASKGREVYDLAGNMVEGGSDRYGEAGEAKDAYGRGMGPFTSMIGPMANFDPARVGGGFDPNGAKGREVYDLAGNMVEGGSGAGGREARKLSIDVPFNGRYVGDATNGDYIIEINGKGQITVPGTRKMF